MEALVPSICLSSVASALLFYAGGRLRALAPTAPASSAGLEAERALRAQAEEEAARAWRSHGDALAALADERARSTTLGDELAAERDARARAAAAAESQRRFAEESVAQKSHASTALARELEALRVQSSELASELAKARAERDAAKADAGRAGSDLTKARADRDGASATNTRLAGELAALRGKTAGATALAGQLTAARTALEAAQAAAKASAADVARLTEENARLTRSVAALESERARAPAAEAPRRTVTIAGSGPEALRQAPPRPTSLEATMKARAIEQRAEEIARLETENAALRTRVDALGAAAAEVEELRARLRDLEAQGFARRPLESLSGVDEIPSSKGMLALETSLEIGLRELVKREEGCRAAVLSDTRGLLMAAYGDAGNPVELAAAASLTTGAADRLREIFPLGAPRSLALVDENDLLFRTRWLRWQDECFLLCTVGEAPEDDTRAVEALRLRVSELIGQS